MHDLNQGSVHRQLARLVTVILIGMLFQTLYYLVDLYFVGKVGSAAVAAVTLAGTLMMVTVSLTQALTVGTTTLVAQSWGRKDYPEARRVFNQSQVLASSVGLAFVVAAFLLRGRFAVALAADADTAQAVHDYLDFYLPALGVQFLLVAMTAALRGAGEVRAPMLIQLVSVLINMVLAPVLIVGWGTGRPLGVAGAGLATLIAIVVGSVLLVGWVRRKPELLAFEPQHWRPDFALWRRMLAIGLPTGGEFLLLSLYSALIYALIRPFGAVAQAGFGVGMRVLQTGFMPAFAISFAVSPVAAQAFGARKFERVRETFRAGLVWVGTMMIVFMALCHVSPEGMVRPFTDDPAVIRVGAEMLAILSFNFLASAVVFVASALFQAMGNTVPSLLASASRIGLFALPAIWLASRPGFVLHHLWWLSVASVLIQAVICLLFLRREMRIRAPVGPEPAPAPA